MKLKIFIAVSVIAIGVFIVYSQTNGKPFAPAEDFPRDGAVLYVQIADLPALIKLWNKSQLKEKYLESENFKDFANNHLGRKLASRWQEFNDATGFPIDLEVLSKFAGNQAAIALYDVGKLDFVFIAPVSDEIFAATKFAQNRDKFTEETLEDNTTIYRVNVAADRGRQKQELIFTQFKGRFILATSEKRLVQTLDNINGKQAKNRLTSEPLFKVLSEKIQPHAATVWLNQTALNDDYYFKHYWLMSEVGDLKNTRAGIFDFEIGAEKLIERRRFLLDKATATSLIENSDIEKILTFLPPNVPFYRLQSGNQKTVDEAVEKTIFARPQEIEKNRRNNRSDYSFFDNYDDYSSNNYESLGGKFDQTIDETNDDNTIERREIEIDFSKILRTGNPRAILTFTQPKMLPAPMFAQFQSAALFHLASPETFDRENFEAAVSRKLLAQVMIEAPDVKLNWETKSENSYIRRELKLPMLNWSVNYSLVGNELIVTNNSDFLQQILIEPRLPQIREQNLPLTSLTVINFGERVNAYDKVFDELNRKKQADDFFTANITSILDSISQLKNIEIKENRSQNMLDEEISFNF
ncbi:MAG: hypothetical protein M3033_16165 [Acidobacteriota bacterium]|nr:hypothetical protein [Acidobacteriota bacterium]